MRPAGHLQPPPSPAVSTLLTLLPPPVLKCRQFTVAGKHLTVLKGEQTGGSGLGWQCGPGQYGGDRSSLRGGGLVWSEEFRFSELSWLPPTVLNSSSQEEISVWDIRILPNFNASYLPVMPDGSVLLVDNVW